MGANYMNERNEMIRIGKQLVEMGILTGMEGNFSIKLDHNALLITPAGVKIHDLIPERLVVCDFEGNLIDGDEKPSSGVPMHTMIYKLRNDVNAVIHTHSIAATSFAVAGIPIPNSLEVLKDYVGGEVPIAKPYAPVGTHELAENVRQNLTNSNAILLQNHGVLAFGKTISYAFKSAWAVEMAAKMIINAKVLGNITTISE